MEKLLAQTSATMVSTKDNQLAELEAQEADAEKNLQDANKKLQEARLGEKLERDQEAERLQVIEQPILPQRPIKPDKVKLFGLSSLAAAFAGICAVYIAESLDSTIRYNHQLFGVANSRMVVSLPYITTRAEKFRTISKWVLAIGGVGALLTAGLVWAILYSSPADLSSIHQFWLEHLTHLSK